MTTEAAINWNAYGNKLRRARAARSYSLRQLAEITDVDFRTILRLENGHGVREVTFKKLDRWLKRQR